MKTSNTHAWKQYGSIGGELVLGVNNINEPKSCVDSDVWKEPTKNCFLTDSTTSYWTFTVDQTLVQSIPDIGLS